MPGRTSLKPLEGGAAALISPPLPLNLGDVFPRDTLDLSVTLLPHTVRTPLPPSLTQRKEPPLPASSLSTFHTRLRVSVVRLGN